MEGHNAQHSHGQDLFSTPNMFRDNFHCGFFFGKVSQALFKITEDDTECREHGGLLRKFLPKCVRGADENCEMEG
jgi:hypothetical protein